jgi:LysR family transcriptional regulator for bpeEF and oprC
VCASPAYLAVWGEPVHPRDLTRHRALIYARSDEESNTRWRFVRDDEEIVVDVPVRMASRDGIGLIDAAVGGGGVVRAFEFAVRDLAAASLLRPLLQEWRGEPQLVHALWPTHSARSAAKVKVFLDFAEGLL